MSDLRELFGVVEADLKKPEIRFFYFIKMSFDSPVDTIYYTDFPGGLVGDIGDGSGSVTWVQYGFAVSGMSQGLQNGLSTANLTIDNVDKAWAIIVANERVRGVPVAVYHVQFDGSDIMIGTAGILIYDGQLDSSSTSSDGGTVSFTMTPSKTGWAVQTGRAYLGSCINIFKDPETCQYAGLDTSCGHSRADCSAKSNLINIVIFDKMPPPDTKIIWGA